MPTENADRRSRRHVPETYRRVGACGRQDRAIWTVGCVPDDAVMTSQDLEGHRFAIPQTCSFIMADGRERPSVWREHQLRREPSMARDEPPLAGEHVPDADRSVARDNSELASVCREPAPQE